MEEMFESLPMGLAPLDLSDPSDVSTWQLPSINSFASSLVAPTIETFLSGSRLRLSSVVDLPDVYRECSTIEERRSRIAGKRLEIKDLRIDNKAIGTNWTGVAKREGREFRAAHLRRRGASRRSR